MITLSSAENALKSVYLNVVGEQLNIKANPLLAKIKQSDKDVYGKEIIKLAPYGINGGIGAREENGTLPAAKGHKHLQFTSSLKNLYGRISLSDKAIRASSSNVGAFVNLLNDEMESLIKSSSFNLGRMLYGDGSGYLGIIIDVDPEEDFVEFDSVRNFIEGMVIDIYTSSASTNPYTAYSNNMVTFVNRDTKEVFTEKPFQEAVSANYCAYASGSKGLELTGLGKIFDTSATSLYGVTKANYPWINPYVKSLTNGSNQIDDMIIQNAVDRLEEHSGSEVNFISCSGDVRRAYQKYANINKKNLDVVTLDGGYKAISFNGIPMVYDRFVADGVMYLLNTNDFTLHQLCDWEWLSGDNGQILTKTADTAGYEATLVKYADLMCDKPNGQGKIANISSTVTNPIDTIVSKQTTIATNTGTIATKAGEIATNTATIATNTTPASSET